MRLGPEEKFWCVIDPGPASCMGDIMFECSLRELMLQFRGGLRIEQRPTIFTDENEARMDARTRLIAMQAFRKIAEKGKYFEPSGKLRFVVLDEKERILFQADLRG